MSFFKTIVKLFPRSKAFQAFTDTSFRRFLKGLAVVSDDERARLDLIYTDIFPDTTREVPRWEKQFGIIFTARYPMEIRRALLDSFWKIKRGGQSDTYLQELLRKIDSRIFVVENIPCNSIRTSSYIYISVDGNATMCDGRENAVDGAYIGDKDFRPIVLRNTTEEPESMPATRDYLSMCFYVCGGVLRDGKQNIIYVKTVELPAKWRSFIEYIVLKTKPVHTAAIMFLKYMEDGEDD